MAPVALAIVLSISSMLPAYYSRDLSPGFGLADCAQAQVVNTSTGFSDQHGDMISNVLVVAAKDRSGIAKPIAFEYQTYSGREYLEFFWFPRRWTMVRYQGSVYESYLELKKFDPEASPQFSPSIDSSIVRLRCEAKTLRRVND